MIDVSMGTLRAVLPRRDSILAMAALLLMTGYFCHLVYGGGFWLEGDADQAVYFWRHSDLAQSGFDLSQRDYFAGAPVIGAANPLHTAAVYLGGALLGGATVRAALFGNMLLSAFLLLAVAAGAYGLLRFEGRSAAAAMLGAAIAAFTGFQLVGVREFDHFYLQSYASVPVALVAAGRLTLGIGNRLAAFLWLVIAIHFSLVGGSNVPMFYYAPVFFLLPIQTALAGRSTMAGVRAGVWLGGAFALGIGLTAPILLDGLTTLQLQNRVGLSFAGGFGSFAPGDFVRTIFLRDWWISRGIQYHERDVFFGWPVVALTLAGLAQGLRRWRQSSRADQPCRLFERAMTLLFVACTIVALLVLHLSLLPAWLSRSLSWYFETQSIRFPMRFGMLLLLPIAHFAALGVDCARGRWLGMLTVGSAVVTLLLLLQTPETSIFRWADGVLTHMGLSLATQAVAGVLILWYSLARETGRRWVPPALAALVFLGYAWAVLPSTGYPLWFHAAGVEPEARRVFGAWDWSRALGFRPRYEEALALAEARILTAAPHLASALPHQGRIVDVVPVYSHTHAPATGHAFAFDMVYDPAGHRLLWDLFRNATEAILDLSHVGAIVVNRPARDPPALSHVRTFAPSGHLPVLQARPAPLPLAFMVPGAVILQDEVTLFRAVVGAKRLDFESTVFLGTDSGHEARLSLGQVSDPYESQRVPVRYHPARAALELQAPRAGYLVVSIPFHPSWVATGRGGNTLPVLRANYAFMAIPVESGPGTIELRFDRSAWRLALWSSRAGLILLGILAVVLWVRERIASRASP
jgi:hypothetical protein